MEHSKKKRDTGGRLRSRDGWSLTTRVAIQAIITALYSLTLIYGEAYAGFSLHGLVGLPIIAAAWLFGLPGAFVSWVVLIPAHFLLLGASVEHFAVDHDGLIYILYLAVAVLIGHQRRTAGQLSQRLFVREHETNSLAETKGRIEAILNSTLQISFLLDPKGKVLAHNEAARTFVKEQARSSLRVGDSLIDLIPKPWRQQARKHIAAAAKGEIVRIDRISQQFGDGTMAFSATYVPVRAHGGRITAVCLSMNDISALEQRQRQVDDQLSFVQRLLDTLPIPVFYKDTAGRYLGFNKAFEQFTGRSKQELLGKTVHAAADRDTAEEYEQKDRDLLKSGGTQKYESVLERANGDLRRVVFRKAAYEDSLGEIAGLVGVVTDITERKLSERRNLAILHIAEAADNADSLKDLLAIARKELGLLIDTTNFYVALYDEVQEVYSFPFHEDIHESEAIDDHTREELKASLTDYVRRTNQPQLVDKERHRLLIEQGEVSLVGQPSAVWMGVPLRVAGRAIGVMVVQNYDDPESYSLDDREVMAFVADHIARAVERKRAEEALRKEREFSDILMETFPGGVIQIDIDGRIVAANGEALHTDILGSETLIGHNLQEFVGIVVHEDGREIPFDRLSPIRCLRTGESQPAETFGLRTGEGSVRWYTSVASPIRYEDSTDLRGAVLAFLDITHQREEEVSHQLTRASLDRTTELAFWISADGKITNANQTACRVLGYTIEQLQELPIFEIDESIEAEEWPEKWEHSRVNDLAPFESRLRKADGKTLPVEITVSHFEFRGEEYGLLLARDLTQRKAAERELRKTRDWLDRVVSLSSAVVYSCGKGPDYPLTFISDNVASLLEYDPNEFYRDAHFWTKRIHPDDRDAFSKKLQTVETTDRVSYEYRIRHKKGHWVWLYDEVAVQRDDTGVVTGLVGSWFDISERRKAEEALKDSEEKHRRLLQNLHAGVVVHNAQTEIIFGNRRAKELLNFEGSHLLGRTISDTEWNFLDENEQLLPPEQYPVSVVLDTRTPMENFTLGIQTSPSKMIRWIFGSAFPVLNSDGEVEQIISTFIDITDRKLADQAIAESAERYRQIFENNSAIKLLIDPKSKTLVDANEAACRFYGYDRSELTGMPVANLNVLPETTIAEEMQQALTQNRDFFEFRHRLKSGEIRDVEVHSGPIDLSGKKLLFSIVQDVTERKRAEQAVESRDRILSAVSEAADIMMRSQNQPNALQRMLARLGEAAGVSRVYLFQNDPLEPDDELRTSQRVEWVAPGVTAEIDNQDMQHMPYEGGGFVGWIERLSAGEPIQSRVFDLPAAIQPMMEAQNIQSLMTVPVFVHDKWWGFLGFDDCTSERQWSTTEIDALRVAAGVIGSSFERKAAEQALLESAQRLAFLFQQTPLGVVEWDTDGLVTDWNPAAEQIFGYTAEEMIGNGADPLIPDHMQEEIAWAWEELISGRGGHLVTVENLTKSGDLRWCEWHSTTLLDNQGNIIGAASLVLDVTDRKRAEEALVRAREEYRVIFNTVPAMITYKDTENRILRVNEAAAAASGKKPHEIEGRTAEEIYGEHGIRYYKDDLEVIESGQPKFGLVEKMPSEDGGVCWIRTDKAPLVDNEGKVTGILAISQDISKIKLAEQELRLSDEILRQLTDAVVMTDLEGRVERWLAGAERLYGYTAPEMTGQDVRLLRVPRENEVEDLKLQSDLENFGQYVAEIDARRKDGTIIPIEIRTQMLYDSDGKPMGTISLSRDIRDRRAAEEALRTSEQRFRLLFESAPMGILSCDTAGRVLDINPTLLRIIGSPTVLDSGSMDINDFPPLREIGIEREISECLTSAQPVANEGSYVSDWGTRVHLRYLLTPMRNDDGDTTGLQVMIEDISERVQSEQELKKLSAAVNQSANAICITDLHGNVEYINPRFSRLTGYSIMEIVGRSISIIRSGKHDRDFYIELWDTIMAGKTWTGTVQNRRRNGELYFERKTISPIFDDAGEILHFVSIGEDITNELKTQQKLAESDKLAAVGMLAAGVSHEFKNYLGGIIGNASFALEELEDTDSIAKETLEQIIEMGERANQVAMSLLTYSKAKPDDFTREDLSQIIRNSINLVEKELKNRSIELVTYFDSVPEVDVSASKIQQLLLNLIINAEHAIDSSGVITIALLHDDSHILLKVGDTGSGIAPENLAKIFDPFFSTKGVWGKDKLVGSGMGLSICRNIAREHSGDLTVDSRLGMGTTFTLSLPLTSASASDQGEREIAGFRRVVLFSLDKSLLKTYFEPACEANTSILLIDTIASINEHLGSAADLVVIDSNFSGKLELLRLVELCRAEQVPYVMVNCGAMEYQLSDLYDHAAANFSTVPAFGRILEYARRVKPNRTPVD